MSESPRSFYHRAALLGLLWLIGLSMRAPILIAAPLGSRIAEALGLSETGVGALTTLPVLALGVGAIPAAWLIARAGARNALVMALVLTGLACGARGFANGPVVLLGATMATGLGIAILQPALPALVARWCPGFVALAAAVYLNGMMVGEFVGAGLTLPLLLPAVGGDWRAAFIAMAVPVLILALLALLPRLYGRRPTLAEVARSPNWRDTRVWRFGAMLGITAATFFGLNAYIPSLLAERGLSDRLGFTLAAFNATQLFASLLLVGLMRRVLVIPRILGLVLMVQIVGIGLCLIDDWTWMMGGVVALSFASAFLMITLTSLPSLTCEPAHAGSLAAGMFAIGYVLAFVLPLIAGSLADWRGNSEIVVPYLLGLSVLCLPLALTTVTGFER